MSKLLSDDLLDRFEKFAASLPSGDRRKWEEHFATLLVEAGEPIEARVLRGVFQHAERRALGLAD